MQYALASTSTCGYFQVAPCFGLLRIPHWFVFYVFAEIQLVIDHDIQLELIVQTPVLITAPFARTCGCSPSPLPFCGGRVSAVATTSNPPLYRSNGPRSVQPPLTIHRIPQHKRHIVSFSFGNEPQNAAFHGSGTKINP